MAERARILVIDDEESFCEFVKLSLEKTGRFEVQYATDGRMGTKEATNYKPELILLDIKMPRMSGAEVADHLLHDDQTRDIPIAFITGLLSSEDIKRRSGYIHGFPFISKPITRSALVLKIDSVFDLIAKEKSFVDTLENRL